MFSATTKEAASATVNDAKSTAYGTKRDIGHAGESMADEFSQAANKAGHKVRNLVNSANEYVSEASEKVTGEIRSNPLRSSAIALGLGFVLGALFRR